MTLDEHTTAAASRILAAVDESEDPLAVAAARFRAAIDVMPPSRTRDHFEAVAVWFEGERDEHQRGRCVSCCRRCGCDVVAIADALLGSEDGAA